MTLVVSRKLPVDPSATNIYQAIQELTNFKYCTVCK